MIADGTGYWIVEIFTEQDNLVQFGITFQISWLRSELTLTPIIRPFSIRLQCRRSEVMGGVLTALKNTTTHRNHINFHIDSDEFHLGKNYYSISPWIQWFYSWSYRLTSSSKFGEHAPNWRSILSLSTEPPSHHYRKHRHTNPTDPNAQIRLRYLMPIWLRLFQAEH